MLATRSPQSSRRARSTQAHPSAAGSPSPRSADKPPEMILFQQFFKSVGPRTYVAQVKQAVNGNQYLVLTEGKRDDKTGEVRKSRLFVFNEDFVPFFKLLHETAVYLREHPIPPEARKRFWNRQQTKARNQSRP
jgi:hypothetical protein